ncbi:hypothetical protein FTO70_09675 [Methanosarcina sp. KYL-1]|uniref:hypothetical protein n=1 Tax=Methanosarcina sp. KYL-1 TaxID=2602068 RepID=UPI0021013A87|nr:hypothetical protein [Methanosarcina sp. KYL-1]MCQ1535943.1 hypothetical protein [Methanosarcina sp. KYL-1]
MRLFDRHINSIVRFSAQNSLSIKQKNKYSKYCGDAKKDAQNYYNILERKMKKIGKCRGYD